MRLPLKYNVRSLLQRRLRSLLTITGVGLTIFLAVVMLALSRGMLATTRDTGDACNVIAMSKGAESMEFSALDPAALHLLGASNLLAQLDGEPQASPEAYINTLVELPGYAAHEATCVIRGVRPMGYTVHPQVQIIAGRAPERGMELAVGRLVPAKLGLPAAALGLGQQVSFEGQLWRITGIFAAPGTVLESECWTDLDDLMVAAKRDDYSAVVLRGADAAARDAILSDLSLRTDVQTTAVSESEYYAALAQNLKPVQVVTSIMTVLLVLGGLLAGMNTMFNSIAGRTREMAVLLVVGYRRKAVLISFVLESVLLCLAGGVAGAGAGLLINGLPMKIPMGAFRFVIDPVVMLSALGMALAIGVIGAIAPVMRVARMSAVDGLRSS